MPVERESDKVIHAEYSSNKGGVANPSVNSLHLNLMSCLTQGTRCVQWLDPLWRYPYCRMHAHFARVIPFAWRDDIKAQIATMVRQSVIEPLGDLPRAWCHPLVTVLKPRGGLDICVDLTKLNRYVDRAFYPSNLWKKLYLKSLRGKILHNSGRY